MSRALTPAEIAAKLEKLRVSMRKTAASMSDDKRAEMAAMVVGARALPEDYGGMDAAIDGLLSTFSSNLTERAEATGRLSAWVAREFDDSPKGGGT